MKVAELITDDLSLDGFHTANHDFSFEDLCASLPEDFAIRLKNFIHAKYELFLKGAEGNYSKYWPFGKGNRETYDTIMSGKCNDCLLEFRSWWHMPDIGWSIKFGMEANRECKIVKSIWIDASCARWLPDRIMAMIEEEEQKKREEYERKVAARKPLRTVLEVLNALKDLDPNLPVFIGSTYDCGYGWAGGNIQNYTVSENGVSFLNYDD